MGKIIHIDMDAFFASVEQRDNPELKGKPVAVGGSRQRGVVAAASYEARKFGVHSALPSVTAARKCPQLIFVKPRFDVYKQVSGQIRQIFFRYTDLVEPLSLDEAYLDVTTNKQGIASAMRLALNIKQEIWEELSLTASAGVSFNKFLAKTASDVNKPNGLFTILPEDAEEYVANLAVSAFHGVGKVTAEKMNKLGVYHGRDLRAWPKERLLSVFGKVGAHYYQISRAIDLREVNPNRIRKSVGTESTFDTDLHSPEAMEQALDLIAEKLIDRLQKADFWGSTLTLKIKLANFELLSRSLTLARGYKDKRTILQTASSLLHQSPLNEQGVRLLGISISNPIEKLPQNALQLTIRFE